MTDDENRGLWGSEYIFSTWNLFFKVQKIYRPDVKIQVDPVAVRASLVFRGWDMEADIMKTASKATVKDLSHVQK